MLLAFDIGNSNITIGAVENGKVEFEDRIITSAVKSTEGFAAEVRDILKKNSLSSDEIEGCVISSVVPNVFDAVYGAAQQLTGRRPFVIEYGIETGLKMQVARPEKVGNDRVVVSAAALKEHPLPLLVVDMGTATTIEVVDEGGVYLGGCIIPGVKISMDALTGKTAQLPEIKLEAPESIIGKNTVECMQSGVVYGAAAMLDGMLDRIEAELKKKTTVIATGGIAEFIVPLCRRDIILDRDLLLKGLEILYRKNR